MHSPAAHRQEALGNGWTVTFTALRVAAVFVVLLLFIRISGKRVLGQFASPYVVLDDALLVCGATSAGGWCLWIGFQL